MGKVGKISVIPKDFSRGQHTMEKSLRDKGFSRVPGTVAIKFPYKELNGRYRTGLDENASYIRKMNDENPQAALIEKNRVFELRKRLEDATGIDLSPTSPYYNHTSRSIHKVEGVKLIDGDNIFNLDDPWQSITYHWLKAHPSIAPSLEAYRQGKCPSDTQYFINDEDVESVVEYRKKKTSNDAIIKFDSWSLEKRRKVARLLDLPVSEDTREEVVYNFVDNFLKAKTVLSGAHKGLDPIKVFASYADLKDDAISIRDLVTQAFRNNIYKEKKGGRIYEGELEIFPSKEDLIEFLMDDANQQDLIELEKKLKIKKIARI